MRLPLVLACTVVLSVACEDPGKDAPAARIEEPATSAEVQKPSDATQTLPIDQDTAKVRFTGSKVTGSHTGTFGKLHGTLTLADGRAEGGSIEVTIDTRTVDIEPEKLEKHLRSADFFHVEKHPEATFESTKIETGSHVKTATHTVTGNLTLHGTTKKISVPAKIAVTDSSVEAKSKFAINRNDFGIVYKGMPDDLIRDLVVLELDLDVPRNRT